jgi:hypothetical protein
LKRQVPAKANLERAAQLQQLPKVISETEDDSAGRGTLPVFWRQAR